MRRLTNHHCFTQWLVACPVPSHYLNLCYNIVNSTLRDKLQWNLNRNPYIFFSFKKMHLKMSFGKWRPFCIGLNVLTLAADTTKAVVNWICLSDKIKYTCWCSGDKRKQACNVMPLRKLRIWTNKRKPPLVAVNEKHGDHFVYAPSQWETTLHCNVASHWLGTYAKWFLETYYDWHPEKCLAGLVLGVAPSIRPMSLSVLGSSSKVILHLI